MRTDGTIITIPVGNYNSQRLASVIHNLSTTRYGEDPNYPGDEITCVYEHSRGTVQISATFPFNVLSDFKTLLLSTDFGNSFIWAGNNSEMVLIDMTKLTIHKRSSGEL